MTARSSPALLGIVLTSLCLGSLATAGPLPFHLDGVLANVNGTRCYAATWTPDCTRWEDRWDGVVPTEAEQASIAALSPDGGTLYIAGFLSVVGSPPNIIPWLASDVNVRAYDADTGTLQWSRLFHTIRHDRPVALDVAPDGTRLFVLWHGSESDPAVVDKAVVASLDAAGNELWRQELPRPWFHRLAVDASGTRLLVSGGLAQQVLESATGLAVWTAEPPGQLDAWLPSPSGPASYEVVEPSFGEGTFVRQLDGSGRVEWATLVFDYLWSVNAVALSPDGRMLAVAAFQGPAIEVRGVDTAAGAIAWSVRVPTGLTYAAYPDHLAFTGDGRHLLVAGLTCCVEPTPQLLTGLPVPLRPPVVQDDAAFVAAVDTRLAQTRWVAIEARYDVDLAVSPVGVGSTGSTVYLAANAGDVAVGPAFTLFPYDLGNGASYVPVNYNGPGSSGDVLHGWVLDAAKGRAYLAGGSSLGPEDSALVVALDL